LALTGATTGDGDLAFTSALASTPRSTAGTATFSFSGEGDLDFAVTLEGGRLPAENPVPAALTACRFESRMVLLLTTVVSKAALAFAANSAPSTGGGLGDPCFAPTTASTSAAALPASWAILSFCLFLLALRLALAVNGGSASFFDGFAMGADFFPFFGMNVFKCDMEMDMDFV